ncbi:hypothetical protein NDU88_005431 [Pleurodeles waltl]|uniref:Uncharacterized protein n=1 Tax=Pleurodeles waltl TaxID=8319 RepID=A0AAV7TVK6_PLEWA|nr:hypothetical protein NDU88_005431 [Pleurodeles waltl]
MPTGPDSAPATPLLDDDCSKATIRLCKRLIPSFYQKVDKAPPLQQITEEIEPEEQLGSLWAALEQGTALEEDGGRESHGKCLERDSEIGAVESVKAAPAGSPATAPADEQTHSKSCHTLKGQQSALESPRMESETRGPREGRVKSPCKSLYSTVTLVTNKWHQAMNRGIRATAP